MILTDDEALAALGLLGATLSANDQALLPLVKVEAQKAVEEYIGWTVEQATYTEYLPEEDLLLPEDPLFSWGGGYELAGGRAIPVMPRGVGQEALMLSNVPVRSVTSLYENLAATETAGFDFPASTQLTEGTDFFVDWEAAGITWTGRVLRPYGVWSNRRRTIKVTYVAGLTAAEIDGEYALLKAVVRITLMKFWIEAKQNQRAQGAIQSESWDGWSISYANPLHLAGLMTGLPDAAKELAGDFIRIGKFAR